MSSQEDDQQRIQTLENEVAELRRELLEQEHRPALAAWKWLRARSSKEHAHEGEPSGRALSWSVLNFFLSFRVVVIGGGVFIGYVTLLLMYQSNLISAKQNHHMQQQIYIQAQSERRRLLAEIKEKLYEPSAASVEAVAQYERCRKSEKEQSSCVKAVLEPAFNRQTRSEFLKTYVDIQRTPLEQPVLPKIPTLFGLLGELWDSLSGMEQVVELGPSEVTPVCSAGAQLDLSNAFLQGVKLVGGCLRNVNFTGANLSQADFRGSDLRGSDFTGTQLFGAKMNKGDFRGAVFDRASMRWASFREANLRNVSMIRTVAANADFSRSDLSGANGEDGDFDVTSFSGAVLKDSRWMYAIARNAIFSYADISNANFSWMDLTGALFHSTNFKGAIIVGALFGEIEDWPSVLDTETWPITEADILALEELAKSAVKENQGNLDWERAKASARLDAIEQAYDLDSALKNSPETQRLSCEQLNAAVGGDEAFVDFDAECDG